MVEQSNPSGEPNVQRRRSARIVQTVPMTVSGTDALGQPFKERTSALVINCHGCKYQSKHYVLKNNWVTLEIPHPEAGQQPRVVRAQVVWVQRPRTVQELFQVAVALEIPGNLWGVAFPPEDWFPYPEEAAPSIPAPAQPEAKAETPAATAPVGKVRMLPAPTGPSTDAMAAVERQVARMVEDARDQIQGAVRDAASSAVTAETGKLLREIESQLRSAARKSVEAVVSQHLDEAVQRAVEKIDQSRQLTNGALREKWQTDFEAMVGQASSVLAERFGHSEQELREKFQQQLEQTIRQASAQMVEIEGRMEGLRGEIAGGAAATESRLEALRGELSSTGAQAQSQLDAVRAELASAGSAAQSLVEALRAEAATAKTSAEARVNLLHAEIEAAVEEATRKWQPAVGQLSEAAQEELKKLERAIQSLRSQVQAAEREDLARLRTIWREQLESDMTLAGEEWNALVAGAVSTASQRLARQWAEQSERAGAEAAQEMSLRLASLRQSFSEAAADAQQVLLAVRRDLEQDLFRAKGSLDDVRAASTRATDEAARLEGLRQSVAAAIDQQFQQALTAHTAVVSEHTSVEFATLRQTLTALSGDLARIAVAHRDSVAQQSQVRMAELQQRGESLATDLAARIAAHIAEFQSNAANIQVRMARQAGEQLAALSEQADDLQAQTVHQSDALLAAALNQIQPAMEAEGRMAVERAINEIDRQLTPRVQSGERLLAELAAGQHQAEQFLLAHRERMHQLSDEYLAQADRRLKETREQIQKEWDSVSRAQLEKCLVELEEKSTDATHTTFEALYKAADWYQKKSQAGMQSALEKASEQAVEKLRERAAELSRTFSLELDHYSRSYTDHTKGLLEESAREVVTGNRTTLEQTAQASTAGFTDEVHRIAGEKLRIFAEESSTTRDETMTQLDTHAERVQNRWVEFAGRSFTDFQEKIAQRAGEQLEEAQREFQASLLPVLESWRSDREAQHREWMERLRVAARDSLDSVTRAAEETVQQYQQRLQNTSNSWMVASVTTLNQHSKTVMETLASAAETRLREACSLALTGMAQTLADQMRNISAQLTALPPQPPEPGKT